MSLLKSGKKKSMRKKNNVKKTLPSLFGMFYKDNTEEGFNLVVSEFTILKESKSNKGTMMDSFIEMFANVQDCYRSEMIDIRNKESGYEDGIESLTSDVKKNLLLGIKKWNKIQNITTRNKGSYYELKLDFSDNDFVRTLFHIMYGIYFLIQRGEIIDDNYNGFQFVHH